MAITNSRLARAAALATLFVLFATLPLSAAVFPWDGPPFASDPARLLEAGRKVDIGEAAYVVLLDEGHYTIESDGASRTIGRMIFRIDDASAVEYMGTVEAGWSPWYSQRPRIDARVVTKDGTVHTLDQAAVTEAPAGDASSDIFSDARLVRAPLPAVAVGSIVEYVITTVGRSPIEGAGLSDHFVFGLGVPVNRARLTLDAPLSLQPHIVNRTVAKPQVTERDGRRITVWELGPIQADEDYEGWLPPEELGAPYVAFSTGSAWKDIAARYGAIVDRQIAGSDLQKAVRAAIGKATEPREIVARLLASIQKEIRYAGVEVGEGSIIPRPPKTVLANKYGDCKDKATLLVAMLREAGLSAHVALLRAGFDFDASNELPGLGMFNHAIVRVENGDAPIWVDPTDVFSRAGELPLSDQGRMALIASDATTALVRTPDAPSSANLYRETRTFTLPESGNATVVEVSEYAGAAEVGLRRQFVRDDPKELKESLTDYAKDAYVAKELAKLTATDPRDLSKPFRLTLEVKESQSGVVKDGDAAVAIGISSLAYLFPETLRDREEPKPDDDPAKAQKKRQHDFVFSRPFVREWAYRIVPPAGYVARTLPPNETRTLGTVTYSQELSTADDGAIVGTFRLDSGKRRLTPAEYEETRIAVSKFANTPALIVGFDQIGQTKLNAGDVGGALTEFRRLARLHPKEAQHHMELARALIAGGLGEAAREEARRAIALEPNNANAHRTLGFVLQHDLLGRLHRKGFDLAGTIAAFRKSAELEPNNALYRFEYAKILQYGEDGSRFGRNAQLKESEQVLTALVNDLGSDGEAYEPELTLVYAHTGQFAALRELAKKIDDKEQRSLASLIATTVLDGIPAAQRELSAFDQATRRTYAGGTGTTLLQLRRYADAAAMIEIATQGTKEASETRLFLEVLRRAKRLDEMVLEPTPENLILQLVRAIASRDRKAVEQLLPAEWLQKDDGASEAFDRLESTTAGANADMPLLAMMDVGAALMEIKRDGNDAIGYRVRARMPMAGISDKGLTLYAMRGDDGRPRIIGMEEETDYLGVSMLRMAARGELEAPRTWLNWLRENAKPANADDPLAGDPLAAVWPKSKATATAEEIRTAAALLVGDKNFLAEAEPVLLEARGKSGSDAVNAQIEMALAKLYQGAKAWPKLLTATERLIALLPDSPTAFSKHVAALLHSGKAADAERLAKERLARMPADADALRALSTSAAAARDYVAAQSLATKLVDDLRPQHSDYTRAAAYALFTGQQLERALELAQHGSSEAENEKEGDVKAAALRTLAALLVESGKNMEGRQTLLKGMEVASSSNPTPMDWYILGRIAENYGVPDAAVAAYNRIPKESGSATTWELAERRLAKLKK